MGFHPELVPYCGKTFRVKYRVTKLIDEKTGHLIQMKNPCIVLNGVNCGGRYTKPLFCPKNSYPYWREIWLERADPSSEPSPDCEGVCQQTLRVGLRAV